MNALLPFRAFEARKRTITRKKETSLSRVERGLAYFYVYQKVVRGTKSFVWPVLYVVVQTQDGGNRLVRVESLLDYFERNSARSDEWRVTCVRAVGLLVDHSCASLALMSSEQRSASPEPRERYLLKKLAQSFVSGTTTVDGALKEDRLGLFWPPRGKEASKLLASLSGFLASLSSKSREERWGWAAGVEDVTDSPLGAFRAAAELAIRKKKSLLAHLEGDEKPLPHRFAGVVDRIRTSSGPVFRFPAKYVAPLLFQGFRSGLNGQDIDEAAELVAFFVLGGGLRGSEAFHLFVSDVQFFSERPLVFLHHPRFSTIQVGAGGKITRERYLLNEFGLLPRTQVRGGQKAGWKGMAGDDTGTPVFWLPIGGLQEAVVRLLRRYILVVRPRIMKLRPRHLPDHPYLLVNSRDSTASGGGNIGDPYTIPAFKGAWERAIGRLARAYDDQSLVLRKELGTTIHGGRHFYGCFLRSLGLAPDVIQRCMHHRSIFSQEVYTQLPNDEINRIIHSSMDPTGTVSSMQSDLVASVNHFSKIQTY